MGQRGLSELDDSRTPRWLAIAAVSLAGLLLEVAYTRVISYKLWYYYTYLVIGLSLLGIGTGGVLVSISERIKRASTDRVIAVSSLWASLSIAVGYLVIARLQMNTRLIWEYGSWSSFKQLCLLGLVCFVVFATFIGLGVIVAVLLGRAGPRVGRMYFADLAGAGLGALLAVPLIVLLTPPSVIALSALIFAVVGVWSAPRRQTALTLAGVALSVVLALVVVDGDRLPDIEPELAKLSGPGASYHDWGPVFRVDVAEISADQALLFHDGLWGSAIRRFDGDASALSSYDTDTRAMPFDVLGAPPARELIIGSAGGNEILASLHFGAPSIDAVELNPVTVGILEDRYAEYTGHLPDREEVDLHLGDGRTYLAGNDDTYDLIWFVAPDSYAANNAASSGAFVLSESYLYTKEMIVETLEHLTDDGVAVVQFGEIDFESNSNRTSRYVVTAREALSSIGVDDPSGHLAVSVQMPESASDLSTIMFKRTPFSPAQRDAFLSSADRLPDQVAVHVPGAAPTAHIVSRLAASDLDEVDAIVSNHNRNISAVTDDAPFFWHFAPFESVLADFFEPIQFHDPEDSIGERVLVLLLAFSVLYAATFLLLPFAAVRQKWLALPHKGLSAVYFSALGLGFMMFEITMIQKLVRFLGYPSYSLTVTLASILVFAGLGALASKRFESKPRITVPALVLAVAALTVFYQVGLEPILDSLQSSVLAARIAAAVVVLAPLGFALGMFMPLGLRVVSSLTGFAEEYVAWSWAVNGFFSVIGAVLTTILSMSFGFDTTQRLAVLVYLAAAAAFLRLHAAVGARSRAPILSAP